MANAYRLRVGQMVSYLSASPVRWRSAKVISITNPNSVKLSYVASNDTLVPISAGADIARRTSPTQTNVWRPH